MADVVREREGVPVLECDPDGPPIATVDDAVELVGSVFLGARVAAVPVRRLDERFFALGTRFAGEVMQKFVNYRLRLAVVGDISAHLASSAALRALVAESNRSDHVWFVPDFAALDDRLRATAPR
ncbi:DUF4180 domain-containing protein [Saccharothrix variisporea]|uniref:Uncharacterized protein DUF4180 n=1 Tax=Saccharothrix variisporea TaxID=543527 RepID=A0A495WZG7_9PSEU|nr:DUF4180 domain-containing protein [Saccharothrix variisporea]RKT67037.1 uncharacterized protein DUF4180 [Saccharothrix variisporea]